MFFCWTVSEHSLWYDGTRHVRPIRNFRIGTSLSNRISNREVLFEFESNLEQHWCSEPAPPQASALPCTIQCFIVDVNKSWNQVAFSMLQPQRSSNGRRADELLSNGSRTAIESKSNRSLILKMMMTALVTVVCSYNLNTSQNSHSRPPVGKSWIRHCLSARSAGSLRAHTDTLYANSDWRRSVAYPAVRSVTLMRRLQLLPFDCLSYATRSLWQKLHISGRWSASPTAPADLLLIVIASVHTQIGQ